MRGLWGGQWRSSLTGARVEVCTGALGEAGVGGEGLRMNDRALDKGVEVGGHQVTAKLHRTETGGQVRRQLRGSVWMRDDNAWRVQWGGEKAAQGSVGRRMQWNTVTGWLQRQQGGVPLGSHMENTEGRRDQGKGKNAA